MNKSKVKTTAKIVRRFFYISKITKKNNKKQETVSKNIVCVVSTIHTETRVKMFDNFKFVCIKCICMGQFMYCQQLIMLICFSKQCCMMTEKVYNSKMDNWFHYELAFLSLKFPPSFVLSAVQFFASIMLAKRFHYAQNRYFCRLFNSRKHNPVCSYADYHQFSKIVSIDSVFEHSSSQGFSGHFSFLIEIFL